MCGSEETLWHGSAKLFEAMTEASPVGMFLIDAQGRNVHSNHIWCEITGYTVNDALGDGWSTVIHPKDRDRVFLKWEECQRSETTFDTELRYVCKDGRAIWVRVRIASVRDGESLSGYLGVVEDITERKQLEEELHQLRKMEAVGMLAGGIAHDFNNLMTSIGGFAQLALDSLPDDSTVIEYLHEVLQESARAADLTKRLLAFSRPRMLDRRVLDLNSVIENPTNTLLQLVGEDIEVEFTACPDLWNVSADRGRIKQILMNLAINARDAMPAGGKLTIETDNVTLVEDYCRTLRGATPGQHVMLAVTDTGCGMDEETQKHVFEPFFTTKKAGEGTGLGRATTYGIVKQHEGCILAASEPGLGTSFKIYLPRVGEARQGVDDR